MTYAISIVLLLACGFAAFVLVVSVLAAVIGLLVCGITEGWKFAARIFRRTA